jgi:CHRD domain
MRQKRIQLAAAVAVVAVASVVATTAFAGGGKEIREKLTGDEEVPVVLTSGEGKFKAKIRSDRIEYTLRYEDLEGAVTQAHIHLGQRHVNGNIAVFLCSNLGNGPAGTQACPPSPATVQGTLDAGDIVANVAPQGITAGEFDEFVRALRAGVTYANVHSGAFPNGEIRAQLEGKRGQGH